jgi:hypothetical protein
MGRQLETKKCHGRPYLLCPVQEFRSRKKHVTRRTVDIPSVMMHAARDGEASRLQLVDTGIKLSVATTDSGGGRYGRTP